MKIKTEAFIGDAKSSITIKFEFYNGKKEWKSYHDYEQHTHSSTCYGTYAGFSITKETLSYLKNLKDL